MKRRQALPDRRGFRGVKHRKKSVQVLRKPALRIPPGLGAGQTKPPDLDKGALAFQKADEIRETAVELIRFRRTLFQQEKQLIGLVVVLVLQSGDDVHIHFLPHRSGDLAARRISGERFLMPDTTPMAMYSVTMEEPP